MKLLSTALTGFNIAVLTCVFAETSVAQSLAIENIAIYDVASGEVRADQTILVLNGVISQVGARSAITISDDATVIVGDGLTVLPGLTDAHVHMNEIDAGTFLANGVTSVRELNGSEQHLQLRDDIAKGNILGPRMLVSSPLLSGRSIQFRHVLLETPAQATQMVDDLHSAGYDYLKVYDDLSPDTYDQLVASANNAGMRMVGHIPSAVGLQRVLSAGQSIEHNEKIIADTLNADYSDVTPLRGVAELISRSGVTVTPTLAVHEFLSARQSKEVQDRLSSPEMSYVDDDIVNWWRATFPRPDEFSGPQQGPLNFLNAQRFLLAEMEQLGVPILAGTDTPNPLLVAGFSLHDELNALVRGGLTNEAAIRAATSVPGTHMPWGVRLGQVRVGYVADLVLVRGNPAEDPSILRAPVGVVANGQWLDRNQLDELLAAARRE
ncbi:MAG: amidohydrolase family protein [Woeseiaceae bacterium]